MSDEFGSYIRTARMNAGIGQELARKLGISAAYLNDLELSKRKAPSNNVLKSLKRELKLNEEKFNDLAGISKHFYLLTSLNIFNNSEAVFISKSFK